ncbi:hypothetical protein FM038_25405 [Shewanella eurypsychrophilus]|uniref:Uncharacterized protein n=1 Tax=Shewanella eurypsychrophilus TaxID=2593656 RepID=A0ABX8S2Y7_9GAMM|nr:MULTISPECIES: hypothetical protein [Shewanella]QXP44787.1 hypothetical protein FM038_25405 [Shewanella eurypsychrophilus]
MNINFTPDEYRALVAYANKKDKAAQRIIHDIVINTIGKDADLAEGNQHGSRGTISSSSSR